jgi:hypothetical protein
MMTEKNRAELTPEQLFENNRQWAQAISNRDADFLKNSQPSKILNICG